MQHAQTIKQPMEFRDLPGNDAVEHETRHRDLPSRRRDSLERSSMGTPPCPPLTDSVLFGDHLFQGGMPVGESATKGRDECFEALLTYLPAPRQKDRRISSHQFICCRRIPLVPKRFDKT